MSWVVTCEEVIANSDWKVIKMNAYPYSGKNQSGSWNLPCSLSLTICPTSCSADIPLYTISFNEPLNPACISEKTTFTWTFGHSLEHCFVWLKGHAALLWKGNLDWRGDIRGLRGSSHGRDLGYSNAYLKETSWSKGFSSWDDVCSSLFFAL